MKERLVTNLRKIREAGIPLVFFDRICDELESDRVIVDDEKGAYEATSHLIETGCKNIIHLSGPQNLLIGKNRRSGFVQALKDHNLPVSEDNIIKCDTAEEAQIIVPELFKRTRIPDGIFAVNDLTAAGAMKMVKLIGYRVPDDVSFVGFTSGMISDITDPPLTSVEQHGYIVGKEAVRLLINRLESKEEIPYHTKVIKTELVIKGSTKRKIK